MYEVWLQDRILLLSISQLCKTIVCLFPKFLNDKVKDEGCKKLLVISISLDC